MSIKRELSIDQQKQLYNALYDRIIDLHMVEYRNDLKFFTEEMRNKGRKGIVLLDYTNIKDMIDAVKNKKFFYEWVPQNDASKIKYNGVRDAMITMNASRDCVLVCSLVLSVKHLYVNCVKIRDI